MESIQPASQSRVGPVSLNEPHVRPTPGLQTLWVRDDDDLRAAQRLRWCAFAGDAGARLRPLTGTPAGHDADLFDARCEHLIVRTVALDGMPSQVVGTCRILTPTAARRIGGYVSDTAFDLVRLTRMRPLLAELGRFCVHPAWRQGIVAMLLWSELGRFLQRNGIQRVIFCAGAPMADGGRMAANVWNGLRQTHLAPIAEQVRPRLPLPVEHLVTGAGVAPPTLVQGLLRGGARVLGPPAWNTDMDTADLPLMLRLSELPPSHRRRFIGA